MIKLRVKDIKLKIVRGRISTAEQRFQYSTLMEYVIQEDDRETSLIMGIIPPTYFYLKDVLNEELDDLERVILHNIQSDRRLSIRDLFVQNNLLHLNIEKSLSAAIDMVVIDEITRFGKTSYNFAASLYLTNGERIPNVVPSDALVLALLADKRDAIFVSDALIREREAIDRELSTKPDPLPQDAGKVGEPQVPKNLYT